MLRLLLSSLLFVSFQAFADDKTPIADHLLVKATVDASSLKKGAADHREVAKFQDQNGTDISIACKIMEDSKLSCQMVGYQDSFDLRISKGVKKDMVVLGYSEKGQKTLGIREVHLAFPGVEGVQGKH